MADTERIALQHQPGWVDIRTRWTYGDKNFVFSGKHSVDEAMLYRLVVAWDRGPTPTPENLDTLDDRDAEMIVERIAACRKEQMRDLNDPNSSRASSPTSQEATSGPSTDGSIVSNSASS